MTSLHWEMDNCVFDSYTSLRTPPPLGHAPSLSLSGLSVWGTAWWGTAWWGTAWWGTAWWGRWFGMKPWKITNLFVLCCRLLSSAAQSACAGVWGLNWPQLLKSLAPTVNNSLSLVIGSRERWIDVPWIDGLTSAIASFGGGGGGGVGLGRGQCFQLELSWPTFITPEQEVMFSPLSVSLLVWFVWEQDHTKGPEQIYMKIGGRMGRGEMVRVWIKEDPGICIHFRYRYWFIFSVNHFGILIFSKVGIFRRWISMTINKSVQIRIQKSGSSEFKCGTMLYIRYYLLCGKKCTSWNLCFNTISLDINRPHIIFYVEVWTWFVRLKVFDFSLHSLHFLFCYFSKRLPISFLIAPPPPAAWSSRSPPGVVSPPPCVRRSWKWREGCSEWRRAKPASWSQTQSGSWTSPWLLLPPPTPPPPLPKWNYLYRSCFCWCGEMTSAFPAPLMLLHI